MFDGVDRSDAIFADAAGADIADTAAAMPGVGGNANPPADEVGGLLVVAGIAAIGGNSNADDEPGAVGGADIVGGADASDGNMLGVFIAGGTAGAAGADAIGGVFVGADAEAVVAAPGIGYPGTAVYAGAAGPEACGDVGTAWAYFGSVVAGAVRDGV